MEPPSKVFLLILLHDVLVGLKSRQCLLENTDCVQHSLSNNNQEYNQGKFLSVSSSLTCGHPATSKSSVRKCTPSPSVVSTSSSLTRACCSCPAGVNLATDIHKSVTVEYFLCSGRSENSDEDEPEAVASDTPHPTPRVGCYF